MTETPISKSKRSIIKVVIMLAFSLVFCIAAVYKTHAAIFRGDAGDLDDLVFGSLLGIFGVYLLSRSIVTSVTLYAFRDRVEVLSLFGKLKQIIYFRDVLTYEDYEINNRKAHFRGFNAYTRSARLEITSNDCDDYDTLRKLLSSGKPKNDREIIKTVSREQAKRSTTLVLALCGLCYIAAVFYLFQLNTRVLRPEEMLTIKGVATKSSFNGSDKIASIKLEAYPNFRFEILGAAVNAADTSALKDNLLQHDTLSVAVEKRRFDQLYPQEQKSDSAKAKYAASIPVYALYGNHRTYLSLDSYPHKRFIEPIILQILVGFGLIIIIVGLAWPNPMTKSIYYR